MILISCYHHVSSGNHDLEVNRELIKVSHFKLPGEIQWGGVDYVLECSGCFTSATLAEDHLKGGAQRVVLSAPAKDATTPVYVMGVNEHQYTPDQRIVSCGSCTTNCLAPIVSILHQAYGIEEAFMTTIHAMTASQPAVDGVPHGDKDMRAGRCASLNIIPTTTGATETIAHVMPALRGRITGMAFRVPVATVSCIDLTARLSRPISSIEDLHALMKGASESNLKEYVGYTDEPLVSSDLRGDSRSCVYDAKASMMLNPQFVKIVAWYDNEWAYSLRMLDLIGHMHLAPTK